MRNKGKMMNKAIGIVLLYLFQFSSSAASPLVVLCSGDKPFGDQMLRIKIEISLPEKLDKQLFAINPIETDDTEMIGNRSPVGIGSIQITEYLGKADESYRRPFVVTTMPKDGVALSGFFISASNASTFRAKLWPEEKTFIYYDSFNNETTHGKCQ